jgi:hypothetical protein
VRAIVRIPTTSARCSDGQSVRREIQAEGGARDAQAQARHVEERVRSQGEEPQAGHRDRPVRGSTRGRQGAGAQKEVEFQSQVELWSQVEFRPKVEFGSQIEHEAKIGFRAKVELGSPPVQHVVMPERRSAEGFGKPSVPERSDAGVGALLIAPALR